jgi:glucosamine-phosphate N-acetyltransferase
MITDITKLDINDYEQYLKLRFQLGEYKDVISKQLFAEKYKNMEEQGGYIYVIKKDDKIIATGKLLIEIKFFDNIAHIEDIVVDKKQRGNGYGKTIVKYLLNLAVEKKCYKSILQCKNSLEFFYTSTGLNKSGISMVLFNNINQKLVKNTNQII